MLTECLEISLMRDSAGRTLLAHAILDRNEDAVEALMDISDWAWLGEDHGTLLMRLAWHSAPFCGGRAFSRALDACDPKARDALMHAARIGNGDRVAVFLEAGGDPLLIGQHGMDALMGCASMAGVESAIRLLAPLSDRSRVDREGCDAVAHAVLGNNFKALVALWTPRSVFFRTTEHPPRGLMDLALREDQIDFSDDIIAFLAARLPIADLQEIVRARDLSGFPSIAARVNSAFEAEALGREVASVRTEAAPASPGREKGLSGEPPVEPQNRPRPSVWL